MSTETQTTDPQVVADHEAVMRHVATGTPPDPELARRVRERSQQLAEETRQRCGEVDVDALIHSARAEG